MKICVPIHVYSYVCSITKTGNKLMVYQYTGERLGRKKKQTSENTQGSMNEFQMRQAE